MCDIKTMAEKLKCMREREDILKEDVEILQDEKAQRKETYSFIEW